jgi:hypothetical protein
MRILRNLKSCGKTCHLNRRMHAWSCRHWAATKYGLHIVVRHILVDTSYSLAYGVRYVNNLTIGFNRAGSVHVIVSCVRVTIVSVVKQDVLNTTSVCFFLCRIVVCGSALFFHTISKMTWIQLKKVLSVYWEPNYSVRIDGMTWRR